MSVSAIHEFRGMVQKQIEREVKEESSVQVFYDIIERAINNGLNEKGVKREEPKTEDKLTNKTMKLIKERSELRKKSSKTQIDKIEFVELEKNVKKMIRQDLKDYNTKKIQDILEDNKSTKIVRKELSTGRNIMIKMLNDVGKEITDKKGILEIATKFYLSYMKK